MGMWAPFDLRRKRNRICWKDYQKGYFKKMEKEKKKKK